VIKAFFLTSVLFVIFLIGHVVLFQKRPSANRFGMMAGLSGILLVIYSVLYFSIDEARLITIMSQWTSIQIINYLNMAFLYFSIGYMYYYHVIFAYRAISGRIMVELDWHPEKKMTLESIKKSYSIDQKLEDEIEDMIAIGRLEADGDFIKNTPQGTMHAKIIKKLKEILNLTTKH